MRLHPHYLITSQRSFLPGPSHWELGFQCVSFGGTHIQSLATTLERWHKHYFKLDVILCVQMDFYLDVIHLENVRGISQLGPIKSA